MRHVLIAAALCIGTLGAQAQTGTTPATPSSVPANHPSHNCMTATDKDWASLGLSAEQATKVKAIQVDHEKACAGKMSDDPTVTKRMDEHEAQVKAVLTPAQYDNWMKWCAAQASAPATPAQKEKM
ncbi:MAG: hypothetical protein ABI432_07240 [Flavobacteriales bacterium]